jgi:hypothetical protein
MKSGNMMMQKLKGFIALCNDCHMIKHIGFASIKASEGLLDMDKLIEYFMKVNGVDRKTFNEHHKEAFKVWREGHNMNGLPIFQNGQV